MRITSAPHRVAQPHRRGDGRVESRKLRVGDEIALQELLRHGPEAPVYDQFGQEQQRHRQQEADVELDVVEKRERDPAPRAPLDHR